ncbi:hypothetical protein AB9M62_21015 [Bacillales bacterium AN1005]|uniref:hypothetical protein n=1 Tax=Niallia taxi TaxID=2499688 RepID=UPI0021A6CC56|nr:hypothetical protein [Niallia taxi]MCT2347601.1 hypothetical protein [Niallia taxi]
MQALPKGNTEKLVTLYDLDKTYLRNVLNKEKYYKVPFKKGYISLRSSELSELIIEHQSKDEVRKLVNMVKTIRKRNTMIKPYIQIIAIGLLNKYVKSHM